MKIKVLLIAIGFSIGVFGAYAQKGVDNGTQFGSGEDSVRCITNISLFVPYAKAKNYADAYPFWKIVYEECPAATKDIYLYGVQIVGWQIGNETDPAKKSALVDDLMAVYDKRVKYFGNDPRYGTDWIISRKAQDYIQYMGDKVDPKVLYGWLKPVLEQFGEKTEALAVSLYMFSAHQQLLSDPGFKEQYLEDYLKSSAILDTQIAAAQAANSERDIKNLTTYKSAVDNGFVNSGAADCETLQNMYAAKIEDNKTDMEFLRETLALFRRVRCQEIDAYFAASRYVHVNAPTAESAVGLGKQAVRDKDYNTAITYFEEAATLDTDPNSIADDYYMIALLMFEQNNYSRSRQYALKAIENNPNYGSPYLLIGKMYAATAKSVYPNDGVMARVVYNTAIDKFEKGRQVDSTVAEEANSLISAYRAHLPSTEEIFMHPDLEKGKTITIGGWINERTIVR
ncbi:hypothetical protein [Parabacteroides sp. PF5-9]|uniref:tetratricopeptide repeat protein n=1 Tax=Parabacteroides sp. PF5-9 TaxID=1742404 RepID=UPI0024752C7B|nr:hypothetical protein [Parabacteroides sp. PF5-9]MDH6357993.1 tetratricopeptide (TPR) repeat protein [Parabacteroides sp. PF5-9]